MMQVLLDILINQVDNYDKPWCKSVTHTAVGQGSNDLIKIMTGYVCLMSAGNILITSAHKKKRARE